MKKILSMLMVSAMLCLLSLSVFASSPTTPNTATGTDSNGNAVSVNVATLATPSDADQDQMAALIASAADADDLSVFATVDISVSEDAVAPFTITATISGLEDSGYTELFLFHQVDGVWELVEGVTASGDTITFTVNSLSPFAVVIEKVASPDTGVDSNVAIVFAVAALATGVAFISTRKRTA